MASRLSTPLRLIPGLGAEGASQAIGFGGLGGVMGAISPEEGKSRLEGGLKGFGMGTLGGVGWGLGGNTFDRVAKRFLKPGSAFHTANKMKWGDIWNRTTGTNFAKMVGAKAPMSAGWVAAGIGGDQAMRSMYEKASGGGKKSGPFDGLKSQIPGGMFGATAGTTPGGIVGGSQ
jgi:hypothetical protein